MLLLYLVLYVNSTRLLGIYTIKAALNLLDRVMFKTLMRICESGMLSRFIQFATGTRAAPQRKITIFVEPEQPVARQSRQRAVQRVPTAQTCTNELIISYHTDADELFPEAADVKRWLDSPDTVGQPPGVLLTALMHSLVSFGRL